MGSYISYLYETESDSNKEIICINSFAFTNRKFNYVVERINPIEDEPNINLNLNLNHLHINYNH